MSELIEVVREAKDKLMDGWQIVDAVAYVQDKYGLSEGVVSDVEDSLRKDGAM
jgi:hypothetical protein